MAESSSGSPLGWSDWGGRHFQAPTEAHAIVQEWREKATSRGGVGVWGDSREQPQTERQRDQCQSGGRDHPLRWQHPPNLITLRELSLTCMCNYTPTCPTPPSLRKLPQHLIPAGKAPQGGLCNDRPPRLEGPLRVTTIQLWPPTSIKDPITQRVIICLGERELFIHGKLIVLHSHCSASKTILQSTKDTGLDLK